MSKLVKTGAQVMDDYSSAIDDVSKESYVDKTRLGCVKLWWLFGILFGRNTQQSF
jgi:hypothetical protein